MKIVVTGGHFTPAYAVIQKIKDHDEIIVVGRRFAFEGDKNETYEYKVCKKEGIHFEELNAARLQRKITKNSLPSLLKFPQSVRSAFLILKKNDPEVVVTFGGYIGLPVAIAAKMLKIPIVLHEQTQKAGVASRLISKFADVICISFESSKQFFDSGKTVLTGNPLRKEIFTKRELPFRSQKSVIYVTGGSAGSRVINEAIFSIVPQLLADFTVIHQTGSADNSSDYKRGLKIKEDLPDSLANNYIVSEFFTSDEVSAFFQNASLIITRSGINTVLELMAVGAVSLLIPLPFGQRNEQKDNAKLFEEIGLGKMLEQKNLTSNVLLQCIHDMIRNREKFKENAPKALSYVNKNATEKVIQQIYRFKRRERG